MLSASLDDDDDDNDYDEPNFIFLSPKSCNFSQQRIVLSSSQKIEILS